MTSENISSTPGNTGGLPSRAGSISTTPSSAGARHCPECGAAVINRSATRCWMCEAQLPPSSEEDGAPSREPRPLNEFMVFLGILAILLSIGLARLAPGVLVVLVIILTPVLIRTMRGGDGAKAGGRAPSGLSLVGRFFSSVGVVALIGLASIATFYATCFAICAAEAAVGAFDRRGSYEGAMFLAVVSGAVATIFVLVAMIRWARRRRGGT